jgi:hypothetical protein
VHAGCVVCATRLQVNVESMTILICTEPGGEYVTNARSLCFVFVWRHLRKLIGILYMYSGKQP